MIIIMIIIILIKIIIIIVIMIMIIILRDIKEEETYWVSQKIVPTFENLYHQLISSTARAVLGRKAHESSTRYPNNFIGYPYISELETKI